MWCSAVGCIVTLALSLLAAPLAAEAQPAGKVWRIGFLGYSSVSIPEPFREGLRELGYVEGQNMASPENRRNFWRQAISHLSIITYDEIKKRRRS